MNINVYQPQYTMRIFKHLFNFLELFTIGYSIVIIIEAIIKRQLISPVVAMAAAIILNSVNRFFLARQVQKYNKYTNEKFSEVTKRLDTLPPYPQTIDLTGIEAKIVTLNQQFNALNEEFTNRPEIAIIEKLTKADKSNSISRQVNNLKKQLKTLDIQNQTFLNNSEGINQELQQLKNQIEQTDINIKAYTQWQQDLKNLQESSYIHFQEIQSNLENLQDLMHTYVSFTDLDQKLLQNQEYIFTQVNELLEQQVNQFNKQIQSIQLDYEYRLIFDREQSRRTVLDALDITKKRIILVSPWLCTSAINDQMLQKFQKVLNNRGVIDIGWGHLSDTDFNRPQNLTRQQLISILTKKKQAWKYDALNELEKLEKLYPQQFRLKLLGTHEKFCVCDEDFAMLGSHNFLTSGKSRLERELGLWTTDPHIIIGLIQRFDNANNLEIKK